MAEIITFPGAETGKQIALYTQNHIYSGTVVNREPFPEGAGLWLDDVTVIPVCGQVLPEQVLRLDTVCVLWNQVVAVGFPPKMTPGERN